MNRPHRLLLAAVALAPPALFAAAWQEPAPRRGIDVVSPVEAAVAVVSLAEEGARVAAGDVVCRLDTAALKDNLLNQEISTQRAEQALRDAATARQDAEAAAEEDRAHGELELMAAEDDQIRAALDKADARFRPDAGDERAKLAVKLAERAERRAEARASLLKRLTLPRRRREQERLIRRAAADELARKSLLQLETLKAEKLRRMIDLCTLKAPAAGIVVRVAAPTGRGQVAEGAEVRERQPLLRIIPGPPAP